MHIKDFSPQCQMYTSSFSKVVYHSIHHSFVVLSFSSLHYFLCLFIDHLLSAYRQMYWWIDPLIASALSDLLLSLIASNNLFIEFVQRLIIHGNFIVYQVAHHFILTNLTASLTIYTTHSHTRAQTQFLSH